MEEDIKILEEIVDIYYDCAGNKEQGYDMRVDMGFMILIGLIVVQ